VYLTRGLLLRLDNEGELASVLARAIAHTALRSGIRVLMSARLGTASTIFGPRTDAAPIFREGKTARETDMLRIQREEEFDADYFGIQYLYESGYDTESDLSFVQKVWPRDESSTHASTAPSAFPPLTSGEKLFQRKLARKAREGEHPKLVFRVRVPPSSGKPPDP
jgi:predicted Zn-dependent protease